MSFLLNKQDISLVPTSDDLTTKKDMNPERDVSKLEIFKDIEGADDDIGDQAAGGLFTDETTEKIIASDNKKSISSSKTGVYDHMSLRAERLSSMLGSGMLSTGTIKKEQKILEQVAKDKLKGDLSSPKSDYLAVKLADNRQVYLKLEEELRILKEAHLVLEAKIRNFEQMKEREEIHRNIVVRNKFSTRRG